MAKRGTLTIESVSGAAEGRFFNGKRNGRWDERYANGNRGEGPYVDGKRQGEFSWQFTSDRGYVKGKRHGRQIMRGRSSGWRSSGSCVSDDYERDQECRGEFRLCLSGEGCWEGGGNIFFHMEWWTDATPFSIVDGSLLLECAGLTDQTTHAAR